MMKRILCFLLLLSSASVFADSARLIYSDRPLSLQLRVDHEHRVVFPEAVTIQVPMAATEFLQGLQPTADTVYWKPIQSMDKHRILAFSQDQQRIYLIDVSASEQNPKSDFVIDNPALRPKAPASTGMSKAAPQNTQPTYAQETRLDNPPGIELTRFASQTLYAPSRLMPQNPRIQRVRVQSHPENWPLIRSAKGESFEVHTHAAWRGYGFYVTAVTVTNVSPLTVELDMRNVRGNFRHLTPQHTWLGPAGSDEDRTVLYLVSAQPYHIALREASYGF